MPAGIEILNEISEKKEDEVNGRRKKNKKKQKTCQDMSVQTNGLYQFIYPRHAPDRGCVGTWK